MGERTSESQKERETAKSNLENPLMSERKEEKAKGKRQSIPLVIKIQVLDRLDKGECQVDIGADLHLPTSTIHTILKNKDKIRTSVTTTVSSAKKITRSRSYALEEMEERLSIWIDDELERNMPLSQAILMEKKRYNLYNLKITGEAASVDTGAAAAFPASLKDVVDRGSYPPEVVFNVDETGLFWKRMPSRTFISREQKRAPGFKAVKDRLTLLLGGNASGDFRIKPLLVYHSQTPRAMRGITYGPGGDHHLQGLLSLPHIHQLIEHTDREDKQSMLDFWKQHHIMKAVSNIDLSWKEETDAQDIEQLVQASGESLNNDDLEELAEQGKQRPQDTSDSDTEPPKELSSELLNRALHQVNDIMDKLVANDPDATRNRNAWRIVLGGVSCYRHLLDSPKKHRQMTLDKFVAKKTRQEEDSRASTSTI
ncbi:tigger transposable element-derived 1-like [Pelobates cultripes]|uniref:Tigger transposable element-derived 1-like n=1 Tax=Pelobates cultripes TaxID=61616 RepID=A0AAD1TJI9_PELCU|nr:tigger transposable element-derived 1-like [Pelobates cultripes]